MRKVYALLSPQGTACAETALYETASSTEFTSRNRRLIAGTYCRGRADDPVADSWTDVTDNDAFAEEESGA